MEWFFPSAVPTAVIPSSVPSEIVKEYREAELCFSVNAFRASSALVRSALEKTLRDNGYQDGGLKEKIDAAVKDGVITSARSQKAHSDIRVLGNDVLHDEWREVTADEVQSALHYAQRILEDLYDDRQTVLQILSKRDEQRAATPIG